MKWGWDGMKWGWRNGSSTFNVLPKLVAGILEEILGENNLIKYEEVVDKY